MRSRIRAFTLVELLVVIGIIALLISILLPALSKARNQATLVACMAQMRDFGNAIQMYAGENKGSFPGPAPSQIRAGYYKDSRTLPEYLCRYLRLPVPSDVAGQPGYDKNSPIVMKTLLCPGFRSNNQNTIQAGREWTFSGGGFDPYPWFGYTDDYATNPTGVAFPVRIKLAGTVKIGAKLMTPPLKLAQVYAASEQPMISETDQGAVTFELGAASAPSDQPPTSNHGGKPERDRGIEEQSTTIGGVTTATTPYYKFTHPEYATNPPRNTLFVDGHVKTFYKSGPVLPGNLSGYGPVPGTATPLYKN